MAMTPDIHFLSLHLLQLCLPRMLLLPCQRQHSLSEGLFLGCRPCCAYVKVTDSMTFGKQKLSPWYPFPPTVDLPCSPACLFICIVQ